MDRIIFHVDVNSAFLSWSAVKRLKENLEARDLRLIPSAVGGDVKLRHGVITACSLPAKKYGVKTGEPVIKALEKCPGLVIIPSDFVCYREYSNKFIAILKKYSPFVEQASIDEAYVDMTETEEKFKKEAEDGIPFPLCAAKKIKDEIKNELGFTVNIGISTVKLLAKMASDFEKPDKIHTLYKEDIEEKMWRLDIRKLHGCGRATSEKLGNIGIKTIGDAAKTDKKLLCSLLGIKAGEYIYNSCNGIGSDTVIYKREAAKSYSNETTIAEDITSVNYGEIHEIIKALSDKVSKRLKKDSITAYTVTATIKTADFKRYSKQTTLANPVNDCKIIYEVSERLIKELCFGKRGVFKDGGGIRLIGIGCSGLDNGEFRQMDIFSYMRENAEKERIRQNERSRKEKADKLSEMMAEAERKFEKP